MNDVSFSRYMSLPGSCYYLPPCIKGFPFNVEIADAWSKIGSGAGNEESSSHAALGEYFERRHFYMEIFPDSKKTLAQMLKPDEATVFLAAFAQTCQKETNAEKIKNHIFGATKVIRTSDFSSCSLPTILLSLSYQHGERDNFIYPSRDTCGCSFHKAPESSIFGAVKESLERQFLTRFWLTKKCKRHLTNGAIEQALINTSTFALYQLLAKSGNIAALDISDSRFPGVCILIIYGNNQKNSHVHYCAGMAYAETLTDGLHKSILELWQTFRFMHLYFHLKKPISGIKDPYLSHFLKCNNFETFKEIMNFALTPPQPSKPRKEFTTTTLLNALKSLDIEGYLYTKTVQISGSTFTFSKFISPYLFLHMDNSKNINIVNIYSSSFTAEICADRIINMVPFP